MNLRPSVAVVALIFATFASAAETEPTWITDYSKARDAARANGKPIFLVFR